MPITCSSGPILRTCRNWSRKSSSVNSLRRSLRSSSAACLWSTVCSARSISDSTSPMPSTRETMRSGIKRFERVVFFAHAHEFHRRAGHFADRKRRAAARVAVELGQHHAGESQPLVEFARRAHRVLPDHGVGDEQDLRGRSSRLSVPSSSISVSSMCRRPAVSTRITSEAESLASRIAPRAISSGLSVPVPGQHGTPTALATCASCSRAAGRYTSVETTSGRWPCAPSHFASLPVVVVLPEPCRPTISHTDGGREENSGFACLPSSIEQFVANDLDHLLVGRKLQQHFRAQRLLANVRQQFVGHAHVDVAFEQRFADSRERLVQVLLRELSLPAQVLENSLQLVC